MAREDGIQVGRETEMIERSRKILFGMILIVGLVSGARVAQAAVKLFMKDGTYQLVKSYEVRGNRVRYYSIERSEWEEAPASLVDFEATRRVQQEEKISNKKEEEEAREIDKQRFEKSIDAGFEIAPGMRLPQEEGVFAFDGARIIRMVQSSSEVVTDKKRAALLLALPAPVMKSRALVVLPGPKAAVRISVSQPSFYAQFGDASGGRLELVTLKPAKDVRTVEKIEWRAGIGKPGELRSFPAPAPYSAPAQVAPPQPRLKPPVPQTPQERLLTLLRRDFQPLYGLLDAAVEPSVLKVIFESKEEYQSLYEGAQGAQLTHFAPYLIRIPPQSPLLDTLVKQAWAKNWGVYLTCDKPLKDLRNHFRHFLTVKLPDGKQVYFRYYDPRVLRLFLPTCLPDETNQFFGPVKQFLVEAEDPNLALHFTRGLKGADKKELHLAAA